MNLEEDNINVDMNNKTEDDVRSDNVEETFEYLVNENVIKT